MVRRKRKGRKQSRSRKQSEAQAEYLSVLVVPLLVRGGKEGMGKQILQAGTLGRVMAKTGQDEVAQVVVALRDVRKNGASTVV